MNHQINRPDADIMYEVRLLFNGCEWHPVHDIAEAVHNALASESHERPKAQAFASDINNCMEANGSGWEMKDGRFEIRGEPAQN